MGFQKGHSKLGGRKRGIPNMIKGDVRALLDELGCNPVMDMAQMAMDDSVDIRTRVRLLVKLAGLVYPQLKAVEYTESIGRPNADPAESPRERILRTLAESYSQDQCPKAPNRS
jgi:hypothetical protein